MSHSKSHRVDGKVQPLPINIAVEIKEILRRKAHLKWYKDKNKKWYIVHSQPMQSKIHKPEIILPTTCEKMFVRHNQLNTLRKGANDIVLNEVINTIDTLYQSLYNDKKRKIINYLKNELEKQKNKVKDCKLAHTKNLRSKMAENEKKYEILKEELKNKNNELKKKNNELKRDYESVNKRYNDLKLKFQLKTTPGGEQRNDETTKYIEILHEEIKTLKQEKSKLNEIAKTKDIRHARTKTELDIERRHGHGWMNAAGNKNINEVAMDINQFEELSDYAPDWDEQNEDQNDVKEEKNTSMDKLYAIDSISESKSMSAMSSLNEFGHKYSTKNLNKCNKQQLIDMVLSLYVSNENFKQELRENILGVGCENTFLNIDEILTKYVTLRTQTHNNLHNNLLDALEEKYDEDVSDDVLEKQSYNVLFHILYLSNSKISLEFNNLYTKIAKIINVYKEKKSIQLISNVLHSTLQTHYKLLTHSDPIMDEEKDGDLDSMATFDLNTISKTIYDELLMEFSDLDKMLNSEQGDIRNYIKCCLEMVVIIQLNKPKLHFVDLNDFINQTSEKFDDNKHEKCSYDYYEYNQSQLNLADSKQPKYIQYYCFPGLCIENNINIKGDKKKKKKKKGKNKYVIICKAQVVC